MVAMLFSTERLRVRLATDDDVTTTWPFRQRADVTEWMTSQPRTLDEYRESFLDRERLERTLIIERDGVVVGDLMLWVKDAWAQKTVKALARGKEAELGWCLDPEHAGQGLATEAVLGLMLHAFKDRGVHRVTANCFADNERSWRLMERVGMRREAHLLKDSLHRSGRWLDGYTYALLDEEWGPR
jgi:RimJ/RimL family protein N-acetyltransferase